MTISRGLRRTGALVAVAALTVAACGSDDDGGDAAETADSEAAETADTDAADDSATTDAAEAESAEPAEDLASFTVAVIEPDITTVPLLAAIDSMAEQGYDVETVELAEPELAIEGMARGDYAISAESTSPALIANELGAPVVLIGDVVGNQWGFYAQDGIESCDDLDGEPVGIFSEGAVATAMIRTWVDENCTTGEPEYLVIGGSDVRAQALQAGEITATALELADVASLEAAGTPLGEPLANFREDLPELHPQTIYASSDFLGESPDAAQDFIDAVAAQHAAINADSAYLVGLVEEYLPDSVSDSLAGTAELYVQGGLFDVTALTPENVQYTIDFFVDAGVIEDGMTAADASDLSFSDNATVDS
ncbi:ABC transporter substrate-binding protein [Ilumatobacter sp.]|uniref:ABC transporter substrate-binding protein n=1 Tax=Ilumatobacter sp. TaxID=1967498 RepID=UPI003C328C60